MSRASETEGPRGISTALRVGLGGGAIAAIVLGWHLVTEAGVVSSFVLPSPRAVAQALLAFRAPLVDAALTTGTEVLAGFSLAVGVATLLALGLTYSRYLNALIYPPLLWLQSVPKIALAPLLILWFGFGIGSKIVVAFLIAFFPIVIQTTVGLRTVAPQLHELSRVYGASWGTRFRKIDFPHALPYVFAGLKVGITLAVTGAIVGEFLSADAGLGFLLQSATHTYQTDLAFATVLLIGALSMGLFGVVALAERLVVTWDRDGDGA